MAVGWRNDGSGTMTPSAACCVSTKQKACFHPPALGAEGLWPPWPHTIFRQPVDILQKCPGRAPVSSGDTAVLFPGAGRLP